MDERLALWRELLRQYYPSPAEMLELRKALAQEEALARLRKVCASEESYRAVVASLDVESVASIDEAYYRLAAGEDHAALAAWGG